MSAEDDIGHTTARFLAALLQLWQHAQVWRAPRMARDARKAWRAELRAAEQAARGRVPGPRPGRVDLEPARTEVWQQDHDRYRHLLLQVIETEPGTRHHEAALSALEDHETRYSREQQSWSPERWAWERAHGMEQHARDMTLGIDPGGPHHTTLQRLQIEH